MSKIIKSINFLSIYDNDDFHDTDFEYLQTQWNTSRNDLKVKYKSISLNFTDNTILNINANCNEYPGNAWFELLNDMSEVLIGTEFIDVIETDTKINNKSYICDEGKICKIKYIKNNQSNYYDFLLCSTVDEHRGYSDWIELIPDYQVSSTDMFEKNSIILLVGLPGAGKTTYLKNFVLNPNYLILDDYKSYSELDVDNNPNVDWHDNKNVGSYNKKTREFTENTNYYWEDDWDDVFFNCINFTTRRKIHNWLKKSKDNKVIIADAKFCNEGYYNYVLRILNIYNKEEVIQTILFNTPPIICEERLKTCKTRVFKFFYKSMLELSNIYNINNGCYVNSEIYCNCNDYVI